LFLNFLEYSIREEAALCSVEQQFDRYEAARWGSCCHARCKWV